MKTKESEAIRELSLITLSAIVHSFFLCLVPSVQAINTKYNKKKITELNGLADHNLLC